MTKVSSRSSVARCALTPLFVSPRSAASSPTVNPLQTCSLCVRPMGGGTMTEKRVRGGPPRKHKPHRHGPEGTAYPPPGPSGYRQPCVAGVKSRSGRGGPYGQILAPPANPRCLRRGQCRGFEGAATSLSEGVRSPKQPVDFGDGRRGRLRGRNNAKAGLRRDYPGYALAPSRGEVAAGETLDHLSRPPVREEKRRRDRLMEAAGADPEWAIGFEDECWWSRVALPTLSSWSEEGKPERLI